MRTIISLFLLLGFTAPGLMAAEIVHDAEYYILEAQNREAWAADDKSVDNKLAAFRDARAFGDLRYVDAVSVRASGDHRGRYSETIDTKDFKVELVWEELGEPVALELPPELTGPRDREMYTLLVESRKASILIDGVALPGKPAPRIQAGIETTTAFLYFAETWIEPTDLSVQ